MNQHRNQFVSTKFGEYYLNYKQILGLDELSLVKYVGKSAKFATNISDFKLSLLTIIIIIAVYYVCIVIF